jgi:hypothetical protein
LKALKKLEEETARKEKFQLHPQKIDAKNAIVRRAKTRRRFRVGISFLLLAIFVTTALWLMNSPKKGFILTEFSKILKKKRPPIKEIAAIPAKDDAQQETKAVEEKIPGIAVSNPLPKPENSPPASSSPTVEQPRKEVAVQALPPTTAIPFAKATNSEESRVAGTPPSIPKTERRTPLKPVTVRDDQAVSEKSPEETQARRTDEPVPAKRLKDGKLKLQAIAYANDPKKRIAVINNRVVHEGESIEGFLVSQIDREAVIVREGGENWKLVFGPN